MLTQMEVFTPGVTDPPLPIVDQNAGMDPIQIKKIDGLGPVTSTVNTTQYGSIDGSFLNGVFTPQRNIVLTIGLNPDWATQSLEGLRQILYSYFMPKNSVRLRFTSTHLDTVEILGYVESCDLNMFSKDPEYQVSILCPQPYFIAIAATVVTGMTQAFAGAVDVPINYQGNSDSGFVVDITLPTGGTPFSGEVRIINNTPSTKLLDVTTATVSTSAFFRVSTVQGDKFVRRYALPSGVPTDIIGSLAIGSEWLSLRKGINNMRIMTATAGLNWSLSYYARYGGL